VDKTTVFIVDKQTLFREGIAHGLSAYHDIEIAGGCASADDALGLIEAFSPNVVLLSIDEPFQRGLDLGRQIAIRCPGTSVIALASNPDDDQLFQAIKGGVVAYLSKDISAEELAGAIIKVGQGERIINESLLVRPKVAEQVLRRFQDMSLMGKVMETVATPLSPREMEILKLVAEGNANKGIAYTLKISEQTIKNHITSILRKLNANDRTHAVVTAIRQGWISVGEPSHKTPVS
jgi:DNA-binding NarL/FixJ family response regulator